MTLYIRRTPTYAPEVFPMSARKWIVLMRSTLDVLEMDLMSTGDIDNIIKRVEARTSIEIADQEIQLIIEVKDQNIESEHDVILRHSLHYLLVGKGGNEPWGRCTICGAVKVFAGCLNCIWQKTYHR